MQQLSPNEFFWQAQVAAQQKNWLCLTQLMRQFLADRSQTSPLILPELEQCLIYALQTLEEGDFQDRWEVAKVFQKIGTAAIAPLIERLQDEDLDGECRWFIVRILGEFRHPTVSTALIKLLKSVEDEGDDEELSSMIIEALANLGSSAIAPLTELLKDEKNRLIAVQALACIRNSETIEPLLQIIDDSDSQVRAASVDALSSFHDPRIPAQLAKALSDSDTAVRKAAVIGLSLQSKLVSHFDLVNLLTQRLWDQNLEVCHQAAIALGRLRDDTAIAPLLKRFVSPETPDTLQIEIIRAIKWIETPSALESFSYLLTADLQPTLAPQVCEEILISLGRLEALDLQPQAAQILINLLQSQQAYLHYSSVRQAIALSLGNLGQITALDSLVNLLADSDLGVRLHVLSALKQLAPQDAYQKLEQLSQLHNLAPSLRQGILEALHEW